VVLSRAGVVFDAGKLRLTAENPGEFTVGVFPAVKSPTADAGTIKLGREGVFQQVEVALPAIPAALVTFEPVQAAGPAREIRPGKCPQPVAAAPTDADFAAAAVWRIRLPQAAAGADRLLRLHYRGDVARVLIGGRFITDDFYNGRPFEVGLGRHAAELAQGELRVAILPLQSAAPIFLPAAVRPAAGSPPVAALDGAELVQRRTVELSAGR
jgi:hypothetical protein